MIPSPSDLSMALGSIAPVETSKASEKDTTNNGSNSNNSSVPSSPARGEAPTLKLGKFSNSIGSDELTFNFGSFGDAMDGFGDSTPWSNTAGTGGWGDEDKSSSTKTNTAATSTKKSTYNSKTSDISGGVRGFFEEQGGDDDSGLSSSLNGPPGLSAPNMELEQMKTVEELEAEQKAAMSSSSSAPSVSSSKPSAPPGMSEPPQSTGAHNDKGPNHQQSQPHNNKPNKKQHGRRNNNNQHNMDKNNIPMMHPGYPPNANMYGGYGMDPAMYGNMYNPNMMMPGNMNHLQQPIPTPGVDGGVGKPGPGGRSSNLVDEGVNNGTSSPISNSRPTLGYGMPG